MLEDVIDRTENDRSLSAHIIALSFLLLVYDGLQSAS
jgi:hypothetical protein